jgi:hypothetical protein
MSRIRIGRMVSSRMLRQVALLRSDVSEEFSAFFIRVRRIGELGTTLAVTSNQRKLPRYRNIHRSSSETYDSEVQSHRHENLKSYNLLDVQIMDEHEHFYFALRQSILFRFS